MVAAAERPRAVAMAIPTIETWLFVFLHRSGPPVVEKQMSPGAQEMVWTAVAKQVSLLFDSVCVVHKLVLMLLVM